MDMFMALRVVMVSWVYTCSQTHQVVYMKYVQIFTGHFTSVKWLKKRKEKNRAVRYTVSLCVTVILK